MENLEQKKQETIKQIDRDLQSDKIYINIEDYDLHWQKYTIDGKIITKNKLISLIKNRNEVSRMFQTELKQFVIDASNNPKEIINQYVLSSFEHEYIDGKVKLSEEMELVWRFSCFLDSLPRALKNGLVSEYIKVDSNRQNKVDIDKECDELGEDFLLFVIKVTSNVIPIEELFEKCYPTLFSPKEKKIISDKYRELDYSVSDLRKWFFDKYDSVVQEYIAIEFQGSKLRWREYIEQQFVGKLNIVSSPFSPSKARWIFIVWIVNYFNSDYIQWENEILAKGYVNSFKIVYDNKNKDICFSEYYWLNKKIWELFFVMVNSNFLNMDGYSYILTQLKENGLAQYVQKRYDEYRRITGSGKEILFSEKRSMNEISQLLLKYYKRKQDRTVDYKFERMYLLEIIDTVIPELYSGLDVVGFIYILWRTSFFEHDCFYKKFTVFRDEMAEIFQLSDIPSIKEYTENKTKVKEKAYNLWNQWTVFQKMIDRTALD